MKIAVCDDQPAQLQKISQLLKKYLQSRPALAGQVETFLHGDALLIRVEEGGGFDLYILDILMPQQNGIAIGRRLRQMGSRGRLIFLTSSNDYAADSYDVQAFFYLLKPVDEQKLFCVLDNAMEQLLHQEEKAIVVETRDGSQCVLLSKILYAERAGRVMRLHCVDGLVDSHTLRVSFREMCAPLLADRRFCLCGASFVLNFQHVAGIKGQTAILDSGQTVSLPRTAAAEFKKAWGAYWLEEGFRG